MTLPATRSMGQMRRLDPIRDFEDLYEQMGRLMPATLRVSEATRWVPDADVVETDDAYLVEVELPGLKRGDIDIEVIGNELTITGEFKKRERVGLLRRRTRRVGEFEYRVTLPSDVAADKIEATLNEGVLTVRVPKSERIKPRRIEISQR
jgi:HSP20 family protein